ncbi:hypothetical protein [Vibrio sp. OPT18]|uniref:hypothetical protein n=1 Tax=Vibrio sp. OPT18 TaxID=2778641 RepID=UPI0018805CDA|nr:hypothetical protein [Vibrio sp. OPT18]MBE8578627.1 hypothetical protein [Vibrio sp. OPT18]
MITRQVKRGRPRQGENVKSTAERARDAKAKRQRDGRKTKEFVLNADSYALFDKLRTEAGFGAKESSEFFEALILKVACKPWYGPPFKLPLEKADVQD